MTDSDNLQKKGPTKTLMMKIGVLSSLIMLAYILLLWYDNDLGFIIMLFTFWILIPVLIVFLIALFISFKRRTRWHKVMCGFGLGVLLLFSIYLLFQLPKQRCNPDIMAKHYEKHKTEMVELCDYMQSVLADSTAVTLEFKGNRLVKFSVFADANHASSFWDEDARSKRDSLMEVVGLTTEEYDGIRSRLKALRCIGIEASRIYPESTHIWFRRWSMGLYSYILSPQPFSPDYFLDYSICPYNDHVLFKYGGPAFGSDYFPGRDEFLEK